MSRVSARAIWRYLAKITADAKFNAHTVVEISADGFTQMAPDSTWRTGWADVEGVARSKVSLCVYVSGVVQFVPLDAFASKEDADAAFVAMQAWAEGPA